MEFEFGCECGTTVSDFTRSEKPEQNFRMGCPDCQAIYAVTVTRLQEGK